MIVNVSVCMTVTVNNPFYNSHSQYPYMYDGDCKYTCMYDSGYEYFVCMAVISSVSICMKRYLLSLCVQV